MLRTICLLLALHPLILSGCSASDSRIVGQCEAPFDMGRVAYFSGRIDPNSIEQFRKSQPSSFDSVVIDSPGGFLRSAVKLAEIVKTNDANVVVTLRCHSACALIVAPSAKNLHICKFGLLSAHGGPRSTIDAINYELRFEKDAQKIDVLKTTL